MKCASLLFVTCLVLLVALDISEGRRSSIGRRSEEQEEDRTDRRRSGRRSEHDDDGDRQESRMRKSRRDRPRPPRRPKPELSPTMMLNKALHFYSTQDKPLSDLPVTISLVLQSVDIDTKGLLRVDMDLAVEWDDHRLHLENDSVVITLPGSRSKDLFWMPDLVATNMASGGVTAMSHRLLGNGHQQHYQRLQGQFRCDALRSLSSTSKTFSCPLTFRSYTYTADEVSLKLNAKDVTMAEGLTVYSLHNTEMRVSEVTGDVRTKPHLPGSFDEAVFTVTFETKLFL